MPNERAILLAIPVAQLEQIDTLRNTSQNGDLDTMVRRPIDRLLFFSANDATILRVTMSISR